MYSVDVRTLLFTFGYNPLVNRTYSEYGWEQGYGHEKREFTIEHLLKFSEENVDWVLKELEPLKDKEFISVDDYLCALQKVNVTHKPEFIKNLQKLADNQDAIITNLLGMINTVLQIVSDEQALKKIAPTETDLTKKAYYPSLLRIQKTMLGNLRGELIKSQKSSWRFLAKVPALRYVALIKRLQGIKRFNRAVAATSILGIRFFNFFDKDKIKKEITQAYEEFATAKILEPKYKFDKYSEYLANAIQT